MMKREPVISIIVPVYNVEKYLCRCIDSILEQTIKNYELILVDDGSTDNSGKICDDYQKKKEQIVVIHKENGGLSSARNAGIDIATGEYFGFVDGDDFIDNDMYEFLYNNIIKEEAEISVCGSFDCYDGKISKILPPYYKVMNQEDAIKSILDGKIAGASACNKLYKREIFNDIRYPIGKTSEDAFIIIELLMKCNKIVISSKQKYYYFHRENSITTCRFTKAQFDVIEAYSNNYKLVCKYYPRIQNIALERLAWAYFVTLDRMIASNMCDKYKEKRKEIVQYLRKHCMTVFKSSILTKSRKFSMLILLLNFYVYKKLSLMYSNQKLKNNR